MLGKRHTKDVELPAEAIPGGILGCRPTTEQGWFADGRNPYLRLIAGQYAYCLLNWSLPAPHTGHTKSAGRASNLVPGFMLLAGSP